MAFRIPSCLNPFEWGHAVFVKLCPQLDELDQPLRAQLVQQVQRELRRDAPVLLWTVMCNAIVVAFAVCIGGRVPVRWSWQVSDVSVVTAKYLVLYLAILAGFVGAQRFVAGQVCPERVARYVRRAINAVDGLRVCETCGYDMRMAGSPRCPECGHVPTCGKRVRQ